MDKEKFFDIFSSVGVIGILVIAIWIASINHYKVHYEKTEPLSYEEDIIEFVQRNYSR